VSSAKLLSARYVVPVRPRGVVLRDHSVVLQQQKILQVLPSTEARQRYPGAEETLFPNHVLLPGLVNMHTHSPMSLLRGYADDMDMQSWLQKHIWPAESRFVSPQFVRHGTELAIAEMLRSGTTCFNELYFFPESIAEVVIQSGMRACIGIPVLDMPTPWSQSAEDCLAKAEKVRENWIGEDRLSFALAPHAPYTVGDRTFQEIATRSASWGAAVHLHLLETAFDISHSLAQYSERPLQRLQRLGLLNERLLAVHMTQVQTADMGLISASGLHVIHCPRSNLKLASGYCPVDALHKAGVNITIGTDGAASNNRLDVLSEGQIAALLAKGHSADATAIDAVTLLEMLTINAARALGQEHHLGSLEPGKWADLSALDLSTPETQPVNNVMSHLAYAANCRQFTDVWVAGERVLCNGNLARMNLTRILETAEEWRKRLMAQPC
jgi:5-methylthioadenosine/S-adenosylhomocysteine deaminase